MNIISITGANSFIGHHLIKSLIKHKDIQLKILLHKNNDYDLLNTGKIVIIEGDILKKETLDEFVSPNCTVINLVYLNSHDKKENMIAMENLGRLCAEAKIKRLIHCSTAVVAGRISDNVINENTECNPVGNYEITKLAIEKLFIEKYSQFYDVIILRPSAVFGPGGKNLLKLANSLTKGSRIINYFRSCLFSKRRMNLVCIENVIAAIEFLIYHEKIEEKSKVYIISDDEDSLNNYRDVEISLMSSFGLKDYLLPVFPIPLTLLDILLKVAGRTHYNTSSIYSCQKLLESGLKKRGYFKDNLKNFAEWYKINFIGEKK